MKKYITKEQWDEVSDEQKMDFLFGDIKKRNKTMDELGLRISNDLPPSIGEMIEFLGDDFYSLVPIPKKVDGWCDNLWTACKEKLNG